MQSLPLANLQIVMMSPWLLSLGVTAAVVLLAVVYGLIRLLSPRGTEAIHQAIGDGLLTPLAYVAAAFVLLTLGATPTMPWQETLESLQRIGSVGPNRQVWTIPAGEEDFAAQVNFRADELQQYSFESDKDLRISTQEGVAFTNPQFTLAATEKYEWDPGKKYPRQFQDTVTTLYVTNEADSPAKLTFEYRTEVEMPEVHHLPIVVVSVIGVVALYFLLSALFPHLMTVAVGTAKEAMTRPLYTLLIVIGAALMTTLVVVPANTFGEDVKPYIDTCLTLIMLLGIVFAVLTASTTVADEIEGKTALTMLSKPISRHEFVLGKFVGIIWPLLVMFVVLGAVLLIWISVKVDYDSGEASKGDADWQLCYSTMMSAVPGLVLGFFQASIFTAISVAISTKFSILPNLLTCFAIYVVGNLLPLVVESSAGQLPVVSFTGKLLAVLLPVLNHFNIGAAIAAGQPVPYEYLGLAGLYCLLYCTAALLLALLFFEQRDLA